MSKHRIFISYSHKDIEWKDRLLTHLGVLHQQEQLDFWTDDKIRIGDAWFKKIEEAINAASVAILLVSADFLGSSFILREEIERLLKRRDQEGLVIFPILVRPCLWKRVKWLEQLQLRPLGGVPLSAGKTPYEIDLTLTSIVEEIADVLDGMTLVVPQEQVPSQPMTTIILSPPPSSKPPVTSSIVLPPTFRNTIGMEFVLIRDGEFLMGSENGFDNEKPVRRVQISKPFYLGKYQVTQEQWQAVMGNNPSRFTGDPNRPVENVSWHGTQEFLQKLAKKEQGKTYRLPTEAEWEYACRAGSTGAYCFGDDVAKLKEYAWYEENSGSTTHPVGQLKPNAWGLYDMHGNVWEWVQDQYAADYYKQRLNPDVDPQGPEKGGGCVLRGGSVWNTQGYARCAFRLRYLPLARYDGIGFRLVLRPS